MKSSLIYTLLSLLLVLATPAGAAVTITVNSNGGSSFTDSTGTLLANGSIVRVGYFNFGAVGVLSTVELSNTYSELNALFKPLAEGIANAGTVSQSGGSGNTLVINSLPNPGVIFGSITGISASYLTPGDDLSVWVFNNTDPLLATEWGIFSATTRVGANWDFPNDLGASALSTFEIDSVIRGTDTGSQLRLASLLSPVPEPGSLILLLSAAGVFLRRKRR